MVNLVSVQKKPMISIGSGSMPAHGNINGRVAVCQLQCKIPLSRAGSGPESGWGAGTWQGGAGGMAPAVEQVGRVSPEIQHRPMRDYNCQFPDGAHHR